MKHAKICAGLKLAKDMEMIDPKEAPEGYLADQVRDLREPCAGCEFQFYEHCSTCDSYLCSPENREDRRNVIFIKK